MYRRDREVVADFDGGELLYLRYSIEQFVQGQLAPGAIRSQQSVNRGNFGEPEDVLFSEAGRYNGFGVVGLKVSDIPPRVDQPNGPAYLFFMMHRPEDDNYAHSEIWSDRDPPTGDFRKPSPTVSTTFRLLLCRSITHEQVLIQAVR